MRRLLEGWYLFGAKRAFIRGNTVCCSEYKRRIVSNIQKYKMRNLSAVIDGLLKAKTGKF